MTAEFQTLLELIATQLARLERRSGSRAVRVSLAVPQSLDLVAVHAALIRRLARDGDSPPDLELVASSVARPRLLTIDFDLPESL